MVNESLVLFYLHEQLLLSLLICLYFNPWNFLLLLSRSSPWSCWWGNKCMAAWGLVPGWGYTPTSSYKERLGVTGSFWCSWSLTHECTWADLWSPDCLPASVGSILVPTGWLCQMYLEAAPHLICGIISGSEIDGSSSVNANVEIWYSQCQNLY